MSSTNDTSIDVLCRNCSSTEVIYDDTVAAMICTRCGAVQEENMMVNEQSWTGGGQLEGQQVNADGFGFSAATGFTSNQRTLAQARTSIETLASSMSGTLGSKNVVDRAHNYYRLAVAHRFTSGRRTLRVVAACLYIVCRKDKLPYVLLDFADALDVDVFQLGGTFMRLVERLRLTGIPLIDPSLFIHRFATLMQLGDKVRVVSKVALRMVHQMKRDWIHIGRRPMGVCGAALLVAARQQGLHFTQKQMTRIVRVSEATLRNRLEDFRNTPTSEVLTTEFMHIDLDRTYASVNPPSFTPSDTAASTIAPTLTATTIPITTTSPPPPPPSTSTTLSTTSTYAIGVDVISYRPVETTRTTLKPHLKRARTSKSPTTEQHVTVKPDVENDTSTNSMTGVTATETNDAMEHVHVQVGAGVHNNDDNERVTSNNISTSVSTTKRERRDNDTINTEDDNYGDDCDGDDDDGGGFSDLSDTELDGYVLTPHEVGVKEAVWVKENQDFLAAQQHRIKQEQANARNTINGVVKVEVKRRKRKRLTAEDNVSSTAEAINFMLSHSKTKISPKINYGILDSLISDDEKEE